MATNIQQSLFALDCGATNWRLYRSSYSYSGGMATIVGEPQVSPLTSFSDRKLPAALFLNQEGTKIESMGEVAQNYLEDENNRGRVREYFKPCIGAHLLNNPLPHQKRYKHSEALNLSRMMLETVVEQIRVEKWRAGKFDERILFAFAFPVHWRMEHDGEIFNDFRNTVLSCFEKDFQDQIRFVPEPEGAILNLQKQGLIGKDGTETITLIFDVGGSTTDIVAGEINPKTKGLDYIGRYGEAFGGGLYDAELAMFVADSLSIPASILSEQPSIITTLRVFSQRLKETLSRQQLNPGNIAQAPQRTISMVLENGEVYRRVIELSEGIFNDVTGQLQKDFEKLIENALQKIGIEDKEINQVVLVGGGSQLFTQVRYLRERFGEQKIVLADNPDEIVVQGIGLEYGKSFEDYKPTIVFTTDILKDILPVEPEEETEKITWELISDEIRFTIDGDGVYKVGRDKSNQFQINREKLSRFHAELELAGSELCISDLKSTNGTFLNEEKLSPNKKFTLSPGDRLRFGDIEFICEMITS
jgi:hypothetical protein